MARGIDVLFAAIWDRPVIHQKKMEEPQAGFMEAHLCGILFVIAGLPQISFIAPGLDGVK